MPTLFAHFYTNGPALYDKAKEVAAGQNYSISLDDPTNGVMHLHKKASGRMVHLEVHIGTGRDRGMSVSVKPGEEGIYMDYGRQFIEGLKKVVR
ncbi:MAG: hypothetical protein FJZ49_07200 [Candidatus Verstraetearchaeota archaeon]|nr:hypothetical protein [Candidatus Verstraetearchaeota archaeon]